MKGRRKRYRISDYLREIEVQAGKTHRVLGYVLGWDHKDSYQEAALAFVEARESWNPAKSKFLTHFFNTARWRRLNNPYGKSALRRADFDLSGLGEEDQAQIPQTRFSIDYKGFFAALSLVKEKEQKEDIKAVMEVIFESPGDFFDFISSLGHIKPTIRLLGKYLKMPKKRLLGAIDWIREEVIVK
jgi:DNA-directed RNA polymerase specialized sigma24 family protein